MEDREANQFCRACGIELRAVRTALERPDRITASAATARDEIGRAFAAKIRETKTAEELEKVAEDVLPEIEKFLESPEEKRLRRIRTGTLICLIGLGATLAFTLVHIFNKVEDMLVVAGLGVVCFFIGLSFFVNGLLFTVPKKSLADRSDDADDQRVLDARTADLSLPEARQTFASVTEHTTKNLKQVEISEK